MSKALIITRVGSCTLGKDADPQRNWAYFTSTIIAASHPLQQDVDPSKDLLQEFMKNNANLPLGISER
jgi:hypothetical protein